MRSRQARTTASQVVSPAETRRAISVAVNSLRRAANFVTVAGCIFFPWHRDRYAQRALRDSCSASAGDGPRRCERNDLIILLFPSTSVVDSSRPAPGGRACAHFPIEDLMSITGSELVAQALERHGVNTFFFLMGAPMLGAEMACINRGMRAIDVRHEQAAAMMAHAYSRITRTTGVCMACSGPGTINLGTGIATALV